MESNPYQSPAGADPPLGSARAAAELQQLAVKLLERRERPWGIGYYFRHGLSRRLASIVLMLVGTVYLVRGGMPEAATALISFVVSSFLRDLQWARVLVKAWGPTQHLIDWAKVERLATGIELVPAEKGGP